jgi:hypothetical protein
MYPAYDGPYADGSGWQYSQRLFDGTLVTASTTVTCLDASAHAELAGSLYLQTSTGAGVYTAMCEPGDLLVGGGADPTPWPDARATLDFDFPTGFVEDTTQTRVYASGWAYGYDHEDDASWDNDAVYAVCLRASGLAWWSSIYLVRQPGTTAMCDAGDRVIAGGGSGPRCNDGSQPACNHNVQYAHDGPISDGSGTEGWEYAAWLEGFGWGTDETVAMCARGDADGDGVTVNEGDCAPYDRTVAPDVAEVCDDGIDNDCDLLVDLDDGDCSGAEPDADADADADVDADADADADTDAGGAEDDADAFDGDRDDPSVAGPTDDGGCACTAATARDPRIPTLTLVCSLLALI